MTHLERGCTPVSVESTLSSIEISQSSYGGGGDTPSNLRDSSNQQRGGGIDAPSRGQRRQLPTTSSNNPFSSSHNHNTNNNSRSPVHRANSASFPAGGGDGAIVPMSDIVGIGEDGGNSGNSPLRGDSGGDGGDKRSSITGTELSWRQRKTIGKSVDPSNRNKNGSLFLGIPVTTQIDLWRYAAVWLLFCVILVLAHIGVAGCGQQERRIVEILVAFAVVLTFFLACGAAAHSLWSENNRPIPIYILSLALWFVYAIRTVATGDTLGAWPAIPSLYFVLESPIRTFGIPMTFIFLALGIVLEVNKSTAGGISTSFFPENSSMGLAPCEDGVLPYTIRGVMNFFFSWIPLLGALWLMHKQRFATVHESELELTHYVLKYLGDGDTAKARNRLDAFIRSRCPMCLVQRDEDSNNSNKKINSGAGVELPSPRRAGGKPNNSSNFLPSTSSTSHSHHNNQCAFVSCELVDILEDALIQLESRHNKQGLQVAGGNHSGSVSGIQHKSTSPGAQQHYSSSETPQGGGSNTTSYPSQQVVGGGSVSQSSGQAASGPGTSPKHRLNPIAVAASAPPPIATAPVAAAGGAGGNNSGSQPAGSANKRVAPTDSISDITQLLQAFGAQESDFRAAQGQRRDTASAARKDEEHQVRRLGATAGEGFVPSVISGASVESSFVRTNVIVLSASLRGVREALKTNTTGILTARSLEEDYQSYCFQRIVSQCIHNRGGYVHYLDGNEVVAFWGVHRALTSDSFTAAATAALNIQRSSFAFNGDLKRKEQADLHIPDKPLPLVIDMGISHGTGLVDPQMDVRTSLDRKEVIPVGSLHVLSEVAVQARCIAQLSSKLLSTSILTDSHTSGRIQLSFLTRWVDSVKFINNQASSAGTAVVAAAGSSTNGSSGATTSASALASSAPVVEIHQIIDSKSDEEWLYAIHNKGDAGAGAPMANSGRGRPTSLDIADRGGGKNNSSNKRSSIDGANNEAGDSTGDPDEMNAIQLFEKAMTLVYNKKQPKEAMELLKKIPSSRPFDKPQSQAAKQVIAPLSEDFSACPQGSGEKKNSSSLAFLNLPQCNDEEIMAHGEKDAFPVTFADIPTRFLYRRAVALAAQQAEWRDKEVQKKATAGAQAARTAARGTIATTAPLSNSSFQPQQKNMSLDASVNGGGPPTTPIRMLVTSESDPIRVFKWERKTNSQ